MAEITFRASEAKRNYTEFRESLESVILKVKDESLRGFSHYPAFRWKPTNEELAQLVRLGFGVRFGQDPIGEEFTMITW